MRNEGTILSLPARGRVLVTLAKPFTAAFAEGTTKSCKADGAVVGGLPTGVIGAEI